MGLGPIVSVTHPYVRGNEYIIGISNNNPKWTCIQLWSLLTRGVKFNLNPICLPKPTQFNNSKVYTL